MGTISKLRVKVWSGAAALCLALFAPNVFAQGACQKPDTFTPGPSVIGGNTPYTCPLAVAMAADYSATIPDEAAALAQKATGETSASSIGSTADGIQKAQAVETVSGGGSVQSTGQSGQQAAQAGEKIVSDMIKKIGQTLAKGAVATKDPACDASATSNALDVCTEECPPGPTQEACMKKCIPEKEKADKAGCTAYCGKYVAQVSAKATACQQGVKPLGQKLSELGQGLGGLAEQAAQSMMQNGGAKQGGGNNKPKDDQKKNDEPKPDNTQAQAYNPSTGLPTSSTPSNLVAPFSGNTDTVTSDGSPGMNVTAGDVPHGEVAQAIANAANALNSGSKKSLAGEALPEGSGLGASTIGKASEYAPAKPLPGASYSGGSSFGSGASFGASASDTPKNIVGEGMNYFGLFVDEAGNEKTRELSLFEIPRDAPRRQERYKVMAEYWTTLKLAAQQRKDAAPAPTASAERVPAAATPQKQ